jgi:hypothetical protein
MGWGKKIFDNLVWDTTIPVGFNTGTAVNALGAVATVAGGILTLPAGGWGIAAGAGVRDY